MSASQDKKRRTQQRAEGTERRQVAALKQTAEKKKERTRWTIGTILVVLLIAGILLGNSSLFYRQGALKVGDETFSAAQVNYYANTAYQNWYTQYGSVLQYLGLKTDQPIKSQAYSMGDEYETWGDYFIDTAKQSITQIVAMSKAAEEAGMTLSGADLAQIDEQVQALTDYARSSGFGTAKKYIQAMYGMGVNEKIVRQEMARSILANNYAKSIQDSFTYSKADLAAKYTEHKDEYDLFDALYYFVAADTVESIDENGQPEQVTTDETMSVAKGTADEMLEAIQEPGDDQADRFRAVVAEMGAAAPVLDDDGNDTGETKPAEPVVMEQVSGSSMSNQAFGEWILDSSRKAGDATIVEQEESGGYYVVLFQGRSTSDSDTVNVRHILIKPVDADGDEAISDAEKAEAKERIEAIRKEWNDGEKTEESFATLANQYSEDSGSNTNGGLYENVYPGQMIPEFDEFCFSTGRKTGDVDLIYSESTGYHLIYFAGVDMPYTDYLADNLLRNEDYSKWQEEFMADWEATELRGIKYVD